MKKILAAIIIVIIVALGLFAVWLLWTHAGARVGLMGGLGLGILFGPARLSGVDFRQWFRDPESPSEIGDDTYFGLVRSACQWLWIGALTALLALSFTAGRWAPEAAPLSDPSLPRWFGDHLPGPLKVAIGVVIGVAIVQTIVEAVWRAGLGFFVPPPLRLEANGYANTRQLPYLPPRERLNGRRRLIVCCDGTWNWPAPQRETNVVRLLRSIAAEATVNGATIPQIVHYHQGVGTGNVIDRLAGGGVGIGLATSVKACYGFLVDNYRPSDEIFLFGFSRGAYVARALGGAIGALGMLQKREMDRFAEAWSWYWQDASKRDVKVLDSIAPGRHHPIDIECIGVFDTVGALGIPGSRFCRSAFAFHETQLGAHIRHAFQALAMDEQRGNFQPAIWVPMHCSSSEANRGAKGPQQVLKQMWFPGVHSNIGGGYEKHGLSDTALLWMISQIGNMLELDQKTIVRGLDTKADERFPRGTLEDSRTLFWKLIGSPIPRPVCVISATEHIHKSAQLRAEAGGYGRTRKDWMTAMSQQCSAMPNSDLILAREPDEKTIADLDRPNPATPYEFKQKLDLCSWLLSLVSSQG
jgi:uncharacterized protein (DUF2235 family)